METISGDFKITTRLPHKLSVGDYVLLVDDSDVFSNGIPIVVDTVDDKLTFGLSKKQ